MGQKQFLLIKEKAIINRYGIGFLPQNQYVKATKQEDESMNKMKSVLL